MTWVCSVCTGTWTVSWTGVEWEVTTGCLWDASIVPGPRLGVATEPEQKEFSTSSQKDLLLLRVRILLNSLLHVLACLSYASHRMSAASAFAEDKVQRICAINFTTRICTKNCAWICIYECTRICSLRAVMVGATRCTRPPRHHICDK